MLLASLVFSFQQVHPVTRRPIAQVMGMGGAAWLERPERVVEENPDLAVKLLQLKDGMVVADLGCGSGYFTRRLARAVAPAGKVYAVDIQPKMLDLLRQNLEGAKIANVEPVLGEEADPRLPKNSVDLLLMVDVYHELSQPQITLAKIREALKADGRLALLEYRKEDPEVPIRFEHKMSVEEVKAELGAEGFRLAELKEDLPRQHLLIFRKNLQ
jgi:ubiquinone/menaquinone biosynthesis C-methylase UbiE